MAAPGQSAEAAVDGWQGRLLQLPLFLLIFGCVSAAMLVPAIHGGVARNLEAGRAFLYAGILGLILFGLVALAHAGRSPRHGALGPLMSLFSSFTVLPLFLAVPFYEGLGNTRFLNAYLEMVSAFTTTGATLFEDPARLNGTLHLWRAQVGWMGGLLMWVAASAILAPLNLGGFEVTARAEPGQQEFLRRGARLTEGRERLVRVIVALVPIYVALTLGLWVLLVALGEVPLVALCHAMSVLSTSGISPVGGLQSAQAGTGGEALMALALIFALSRVTFSTDTVTSDSGGLRQDPELRIGLAIVVAVPLVLFARHYLGAFEVGQQDSLAQALQALWGGLFTVLSFLTTTGFVSDHWASAQAWSGLQNPGMILMGLALIGGGVATTAGGVKLLRVFALYQNGLREMEKLVHPSSVSAGNALTRRLLKGGAFIAWVSFMLLALSLAGVTMLLALSDADLQDALTLAVASLSNTGPLLIWAGAAPISLMDLSVGAKAVFAAAMVLGRLETLAIIALFSPSLWRA